MKYRVIVLDDDKANRRIISLALERKGYEVIACEEPTVCPIYTDKEQLCDHEDACGDFLLTDNRMPKMTGLDFIEAQSRKGCKGVLSNKAVLSGSWMPEDKERAEELGCKVFKKPYRIAELLEWLSEREKEIPPDRKLADLDEGEE